MSAYKEFIGKTVEEALRAAREEFGVGLDDLDFEILTPGSRGVLGMGAEPARIIAAPRALLGGAAPKREAAATQPVARPEPRPAGSRPPREERRPWAPAREGARGGPRVGGPVRPERPERGPRPDRGRGRPPRTGRPEMSPVAERDVAELSSARAAVAAEGAELGAAAATPEELAVAREILAELMARMGLRVRIDVIAGETSRLNIVGEGGRQSLGALIGRKGERLSALQHLLNLILSKRLGTWTRVLVDVEDYRGRRERQLRDLARRAAARVLETGKMLQLEPMPALERRWVHLELRDHPAVATQSIGEEPNRRVVVLPKPE
jgi:spoIIIJ-associated protein